ncbi:MAG: glutamine-hydrolyzing GMP synthase, partial [Gammaproteobacteria bacterium]|nr:glutamine-hydrolyzing GMP synthase [Gammaproteobacteria bacterium]NIV20615.1 glutamine-hydrolyzing GMP synthase [Gammaproteobacteria bacterium]
MTLAQRDYIAVIDFGGQYAHLIAKRIRHAGVYALVFAPLTPLAELADAKGVVLSGGPRSVFGEEAVPFNPALLEVEVPLLGLCYGHQLVAHHLGGKVNLLEHGEYGKTPLTLAPDTESPLLEGVEAESEVWMSHGDTVLAPPPGFRVLGRTPLCPVAAMG